jgi:hypothetical protein
MQQVCQRSSPVGDQSATRLAKYSDARHKLKVGSARLTGVVPDLQNRCEVVLLPQAGSIPVRFRQGYYPKSLS